MKHPTTLAVAEIKRALIRASSTNREIPTTAMPAAASGAGIESGPAWVLLADGKHADGVLYRRVKRDVMAQIPSLSAGRILAINTICSPEFWSSLDKAEKQQAGRCLVHMVSTNEVNLALVSLNGTGPQLYCKA